jgi:hypothetical protein
MSLEQWLQNGYIIKQTATAPEVLQLLSIVERELSDASVEAVSADGRFTHAYNAALTLCRIALRASGYRVGKGGGHHYEINSIVHTLGHKYNDHMILLSQYSKKRGREMYDRTGVVDTGDVEDLIETGIQLRIDVLAWLMAEHPDLYSP